MIKRYIQEVTVYTLDSDNEKESLRAIAKDLPAKALRRMSTLGVLMHAVTKNIEFNSETSLIYGTTFTESNSLERYLDSLPYASPTAFQTSIHPSGIEQALILRKQSVGPFFPLAGNDSLFVNMLRTAFATTTHECVICGGEESGGWLRDFEIAHERSFGFSMLLSMDNNERSIGEIIWDQENDDSTNNKSFEESVVKIQRQESFKLSTPCFGTITMAFR